MSRDVYPLTIWLPDGERAEYIAQSRPPRYAIDGRELAISVEIPDDLVESGWHWHGTMLHQRQPPGACDADGLGPGIGIITSRYPPPLWNVWADGQIRVPEHIDSIFVQARAFDIRWREYQAARAAKAAAPAAKPKRKHTRQPSAPAPVVAVAPEQMELAL